MSMQAKLAHLIFYWRKSNLHYNNAFLILQFISSIFFICVCLFPILSIISAQTQDDQSMESIGEPVINETMTSASPQGITSASPQGIIIEPSEMKISVSEDKTNNIKDRTIYVIRSGSNVSVSDFNVLSSDLIQDGQQDWIPSSKITIQPPTFNLASKQAENLTLKIESKDSEPGIYSGKLFFIGQDLTTTIPLTLTIHSNAFLGLTLLALGVFVNFIVKFMRLKLDEKQASEEAIKSAMDKQQEIVSEKMKMKKELDAPKLAAFYDNTESYKNSRSYRAYEELEEAKKELRRGHFRESKKLAEDAINLSRFVSSDPNELGPKESGNPPEGKRLWFLSSPKRGDYAVFGSLTLILAVTVIQVWQANFQMLSTFGVRPVDYITAFTIGFGAQGLLSEGIDFAKRTIIKE
jgi:hypothetical protein